MGFLWLSWYTLTSISPNSPIPISWIPTIINKIPKRSRGLPPIGFPMNISTIIDRVDDPAYATAVGLILWANEYLLSGQGRGVSNLAKKVLETAGIERMRKFFKQFLP